MQLAPLQHGGSVLQKTMAELMGSNGAPRVTTEDAKAVEAMQAMEAPTPVSFLPVVEVGLFTLNSFYPYLDSEYKVKKMVSSLCFQIQLVPLRRGQQVHEARRARHPPRPRQRRPLSGLRKKTVCSERGA
jgi:hypothetical protein